MTSPLDHAATSLWTHRSTALADGPVHDRRRGPFDDVHRHGHRRQRTCGDGHVEEHVPEVSSRALLLEERVAPCRRPRSEGTGTVVEVDEFLESCVPITRPDMPTPPVTQAPERGERPPTVGPEQRVRLRLDHGYRGQRRRRGGGHVQCGRPTQENPTR